MVDKLKQKVVKHPNRYTKDAVMNIKKDIQDSVLVRHKSIFGDKFIFDEEKYKKLTHDSLTYGEIAKNYGLKKGELANANGLTFDFATRHIKDKRGDNFDNYYPQEFGHKDVLIPEESILEKILKTK